MYEPENHNSFTQKAKWIKRYPKCIPKPHKESGIYFQQLRDIIWVPETRYLDSDYHNSSFGL